MYFNYDLRAAGRITNLLFGENVSSVLLERRAYNYLNRYSDEILKGKTYSLTKKKDNMDVVWVCWLQGIESAPALSKACIDSIKKNVNKEVVLITEKNISEYVDIPSFIWERYKNKQMRPVAFSDVVRMCLLSLYGGCWIDATVYCMREIKNEWIDNDLFMFHIPDYGRKFKLTASWWIATKPGNKLITALRDCLLLYWEKETKIVDYYLPHKFYKQLVDKNNEFKKMYDNMPYFETGHTHRLKEMLSSEYTDEKMKEIAEVSSVQKLTNHINFNGDSNNIYSFIVKEYK